MDQAVFIDPSYESFLGNRLFDLTHPDLNRDDQLLPMFRLRADLEARGVSVHTADRLTDSGNHREVNHYWSFGLVRPARFFAGIPGIRLRGFALMEPPLIAPELYAQLPELTSAFEEVYVHNTSGDGYSLAGVRAERLRKLHYPQPYADVLPGYWNRQGRLNKLVMVSGNHRARNPGPEYYSERLNAVGALARKGAIDLYGRGWQRWWARSSCWWPYWKHRIAVMQSFRGACPSKWDVLSRYRFSLCFENMPMRGYLTEKIFDCFYAGTVPVYLGAPDIEDLISPRAYVDMRKFSSYDEMLECILTMSKGEWESRRHAAHIFLRTRGASLYAESLSGIIRV